uniref:Uncharacterized protein n=1 Tax=Coccidioides posadasii RMSCC 3488 TaxID=454284 RepID=A0A0J6FPM7_COCPO|nr:hypothetical protein CPAG_08630 [Coccidioides posadasii RMSCC 3488]
MGRLSQPNCFVPSNSPADGRAPRHAFCSRSPVDARSKPFASPINPHLLSRCELHCHGVESKASDIWHDIFKLVGTIAERPQKSHVRRSACGRSPDAKPHRPPAFLQD